MKEQPEPITKEGIIHYVFFADRKWGVDAVPNSTQVNLF